MEETEHAVKVGNRVLHKEDVAEIPKRIIKNLLQSTNPETFVPSGKEKEIYTGKCVGFISKETKGAKAKTVGTISPETQKKRALGKTEKEHGDRLGKMIAENKAKAEEKK